MNWKGFFKQMDSFWAEFLITMVDTSVGAMVFLAILLKHGG